MCLIPPEVQFRVSANRCPGDRGKGQVCQESTNYQAFPGKAVGPRAEAFGKTRHWVNTHIQTCIHGCSQLFEVFQGPSLIHHSFSLTLLLTLAVHRDRVVSYSLGRRLPTDHVCGQLQFRFELTSSIHPGTQGISIDNVMHLRILFTIIIGFIVRLTVIHAE